MIIFHEGLPRSGKSYEACVNQIIPALKSGRQVYAFIDGLDHQKFSEVTGLTIDRVKELLHSITEEQVKTVDEHVPNDCLVLIDELQDYFPAGKSILSPGITKFVTQHGHRGIDIVAMGQDYRDCHMLFKRRIHTLIQFEKQDAIGRPNKYTWKSFKQVKETQKFIKLRSGIGEYDPKYFGLYKSHNDGVKDIDVINDDRTNILKSSIFKFGFPALFLAGIGCVYFLYNYFVPDAPEPKNETVTVTTKSIDPPKPIIQPVPVPPKEEKKPEYKAVEFANFIEMYLEKNRPRLSAFVQASDGSKILLKIDFYDGDKIIDTFNYKQFVEFGYTITKKEFGVLVEKNGKQYPVTMWPRELRNEEQNKLARGYSSGVVQDNQRVNEQSVTTSQDQHFGKVGSIDGEMVQMAGPGL
ncbi:MAG: zonular occludens toxin domain-containing protein [Methylococcales bacterium]|nr:zonular occludens toxin domain-containing protein [Methylococcales bacterium]